MADKLNIDKARAALLIMDYQSAVVAGYADDRDSLLQRAGAVLAGARQGDVKVIYIKVGFRPGYPEVSPRNVTFSAIKGSGRFLNDEDAQIVAEVAPRHGDIVVIKHRVSAFAGTDLDMILRANDIDTLIMFGIATSGVVLSTIRYAADADYRVVLVKDCCSDHDPVVHSCLVDRIFPRQTTVVTAEELLQALSP